jgi:hypothetical protein
VLIWVNRKIIPCINISSWVASCKIWIGEDGKISDMCCPLEELAEEEARPAVGLVIWYPEGEFINFRR